MKSMNLAVKELGDDHIDFVWEKVGENTSYKVFWSDRCTPKMEYKCMAELPAAETSAGEASATEYTLKKATHIPHYVKVEAYENGEKIAESTLLKTPVKKVFREQLEKLNRGLIAVKTAQGVFLGWRMMLDEVTGYSETGMTGTDYNVYKNGKKLAFVTDSTNYLDGEGTVEDTYTVSPVRDGVEGEQCEETGVWKNEAGYVEIPMRKPEGGVTPAGQEYEYRVNDMSVGDVDGDGDYEFIVKWDPSNSQDVSIKGYTGKCYIDCYKLDGRLLWRLDMGVNIRAGAHYTQFMVYDFDGDGKAEMSVKSAPGTCMTVYNEDGSVKSSRYITMPAEDIAKGYSHEDNYVCSAEAYYEHIVEMFREWRDYDEVKSGQWPATLEECFGIEPKYSYPLSDGDARALTDYFMDVYAPSRSGKNELRKFEGFIFKGPEYLTMFGGDGSELETIAFPHPRVDDGLRWGDYAMPRIEPCNRVDRFLSGVAYLDGERPYLVICRGYYTRATVVAYDFFEGKHRVRFDVDSGFVPMSNPFNDHPHEGKGSDPVYGILAGQGDHALSTADVDGDGCQEIIYGAAVIDHDGSVLYSSYGFLPDGTPAKFGHGDAMHVAVIDPDRPGYQIFNVFEGAKFAPYGWALRDAETGEAFFGEYAERDLGRCMIGDVNPDVRGLQVWVGDIHDCKGNVLPDKHLGTNANIRWAADLSTQIVDGVSYLTEEKHGVIGDNTHGVMLNPQGTATNNGTKGNPCLIADVFGDFRDEIILRTADNNAIRIYTNTEITGHKLFTLMHDTMYRTGIAWQNNCYNQPCYTKFYYAGDMDFSQVLPALDAEIMEERR